MTYIPSASLGEILHNGLRADVNLKAFECVSLLNLDLKSVGIEANANCTPIMDVRMDEIRWEVQIIFKTIEDMNFYKLACNPNIARDVNMRV